ncbi:alpha/beta fold hydrolase [Streptomyces sp. NPDC090022]|uniref:alpha/beta fold hydrolase n=1 Tax=Streptomyces sp. NPDC090022 TaxID=3365920 RepID=UPI0038282D09
MAPDQRGYSPGVRPPAVEDYAVRHLSDDVLRIVDALGWGDFHLAGHDWGAAVAWVTATRVPHRVRTLTSVSVPHPGAFGRALREDPVQRRKSRYMHLFRQPSPVPEQAVLAHFDRLGLPVHRSDFYYRRFAGEPGLLTAALNWYRAGGLPQPARTAVPTLLIASTSDAAIARSGVDDTVNWVAAPYRLELLEDVGHFIPEEAPEVTSRLLLEHVCSVP